VLHDSAFSGGVNVSLQSDPALVAATASSPQQTYIIDQNFSSTHKYFYSVDNLGNAGCTSTNDWCIVPQIIPNITCTHGVHTEGIVYSGKSKIASYQEDYPGNVVAKTTQGLLFQGKWNDLKKIEDKPVDTHPSNLNLKLIGVSCLAK
jgi:hypothetical protein